MNKRHKSRSGIQMPASVAPTAATSEVGQLHLAIDEGIEHSELNVVQTAEVAAQVESGELTNNAVALAPWVEVMSVAPIIEQKTLDSRLEDAESKQVEVKQTLGERLRTARESRGISREEMSRRLRVSPSVVQDIESDQWGRLGASVYVRGHLNNYAKALEVPPVVVAHALQSLEEQVPLTLTAVAASAPVSWWGRYSSAATYVVLTLLLAIPVFTMVPKRGVNSPIPQVRSMEDSESGLVALTSQPQTNTLAVTSPPSALRAPPPEDFVGPPESAAGLVTPTTWPVPTVDNAPLMASMTPIGSMNEPAELAAGTHRVELTFTQDSWLEVIDHAGAQLDYGMARTGETRTHVVNDSIAMSIGNVSGVQLKVDGKPVDLLPFARLNVARLKLFEPEPTSARPSR
jgi:cytoskeleton protein RodZ